MAKKSFSIVSFNYRIENFVSAPLPPPPEKNIGNIAVMVQYMRMI